MNFLSFFIDSSATHRYAGSCIAVAAICFFTLKTHDHLADTIKTRQLELRKAQQNHLRQKQLYRESKQITDALASAKELLSQRAEQADSIESPLAYIVQQAASCKATIESCSTDSEKIKSWYTKQKIHVQASGTLHELMNFLEKLRTSGKMIECKHLQLTWVGTHKFNVSCTLNALTLTSYTA